VESEGIIGLEFWSERFGKTGGDFSLMKREKDFDTIAAKEENIESGVFHNFASDCTVELYHFVVEVRKMTRSILRFA
jgi:hypothetical protein